MEQSKSIFEQFKEFNRACKNPEGSISAFDPNNVARVEMNWRLIDEEVNKELKPALDLYLANPTLENLAEVADGAVDAVYVILQLCVTLAIPFDKVWDEIHKSNMAKVLPTGEVLRRADGKILKPFGWLRPDVWNVLKVEQDREHFRQGTSGAIYWKDAQVD